MSNLNYKGEPFRNINEAWVSMIETVYDYGVTEAPRGLETKELLCSQTSFDMGYPIISLVKRELSYKFLAAEAWWILTGRNDLETIARYNKRMRRFSGNGTTLYGAYGVRINDQLDYVVDTLVRDISSRQAVIQIWKENPKLDPDIPCTISAQFLIRDNKIHCIDTMRSSDSVWGFCYDAFNFVMLSTYILLKLRAKDTKFQGVTLGNLYFQAGSQHIYEHHYDMVKKCINDQAAFPYDRFDVDAFGSYDELIAWLMYVSDHEDPRYAINPSRIGEAINAYRVSQSNNET